MTWTGAFGNRANLPLVGNNATLVAHNAKARFHSASRVANDLIKSDTSKNVGR